MKLWLRLTTHQGIGLLQQRARRLKRNKVKFGQCINKFIVGQPKFIVGYEICYDVRLLHSKPMPLNLQGAIQQASQLPPFSSLIEDAHPLTI